MSVPGGGYRRHKRPKKASRHIHRVKYIPQIYPILPALRAKFAKVRAGKREGPRDRQARLADPCEPVDLFADEVACRLYHKVAGKLGTGFLTGPRGRRGQRMTMLMAAERAYRRVLAAYPADCQPRSAEFLAGSGGFSGALFWRLDTPRGPLCLRRWPREHPSRDQLEFIQAVLWHVYQEGFRLIPLPLETREHAGYVCEAGHFWELSPWLPGTANFRQSPSPAKLRAALMALARFHQAAASFPLPTRGPLASPGILDRVQRLRAWLDGKLSSLAAALCPADWPELAPRARRLIRLFSMAAEQVSDTLASAAALAVPLQPCIRDIWHDHLLFVGERVSGLVDFGALRAESVAADIARLLGSLCGDAADNWQLGLAAYQEVRPLGTAEMLLVSAFDRANVLLSGMNWLDWIYLQSRQFDDRAAIESRLDENQSRLEHLAEVWR
jgi:Ser/Thr protein kinase RdoA (MazF antagonist)